MKQLENEAEEYKGKLPKYIEERFDEKFPNPLYDEDIAGDVDGENNNLKSFIAKILEEEREKIKNETKQFESCSKCSFFHLGDCR